MFDQSGVLASSKSASQTLAPELSALTVIFLSVGPVISTRRSTSPGAGGATCQAAVGADDRGLREEVERPAAGQLGLPVPPGREGLRPPVRERVVQPDEQLKRPRGKDLDVPFLDGPGDLYALRHGQLLPPRRPS